MGLRRSLGGGVYSELRLLSEECLALGGEVDLEDMEVLLMRLLNFPHLGGWVTVTHLNKLGSIFTRLLRGIEEALRVQENALVTYPGEILTTYPLDT